jgi:hypothetical protein
MTVAWIEGGMKESPEEMVALVAKLVRPGRPGVAET